jgi:SAM-dependent methyltransferase
LRKVATAFLVHAFNAVFRPAVAPRPARGFLRALVAQPRVFDLVSLAIQVRWLGGVRAVETQSREEDKHLAAVHAYNAGVTTNKIFTSTRRAEPVYAIAGMPMRMLADDKLLIVGPRNVQEFLIAWIHGFSWPNIDAIDLYSTHPKIQVMDMHRIAFPDASYDVVTMVNTLGYASDIPQVLAHVFRILKPGGRFCFTHAYAPENPLFEGDLTTGQAIMDACSALGFRLYFHHSHQRMNSRHRMQTSHFIGFEKPPSDPRAA